MEKLLNDLDVVIDSIWLDEPEDIRRMLSIKTSNVGQNFPVWTFAYSDLWLVQNMLYTYYCMLEDETNDFETIKVAILNVLKHTTGFAVGVKLLDYKALLERCIDVIKKTDNKASLAILVRRMQLYVCALRCMVDISLPWNEMGLAYEKLMEEYIPVSRKNN